MSRKYVPIDDAVAAQIEALHKKYPKLGHHGILEALKDEGSHVDPAELEDYMSRQHISAEKEFRPLKFKGPPGWLGGRQGE